MEFIRLLTKIVIFIKLFAIINVQCHFPLNSTTTATEPAKYLNTHNNKIAPPSRSRPAQPNYLDFIDQVNSNDRLIFSEANLEDKFSLSGTGNVLPDEEDDNFMGYRSNNSQFDQNQYEFLRPIHYKIKFRPIFDPIDSGHGRFTVPSSITILFKCYKATNFITLNAKLLNIDETSVTVTRTSTNEIPTTTKAAADEDDSDSEETQLRIKTKTTDEINEEYIIELLTELQPGQEYQIQMDYIAKVFTDRLNGIYFSNYTIPNSNDNRSEAEKETKYLVLTQFEPKAARQAYPSFDYPNQKATFDISVGRREKYNSLCNMDLEKSEPIENLEGWYWDHYKTTAKMSTYLIAFVVSEYTSETSPASLFHGKPVKIWGAKHYIEEGAGVFAASAVAKILTFYENFFDVKYPLPKMDSVAIPHFSAGAMENYGLNTYRINLLLYFPKKSTERDRFFITSVVAHELAHQNFGNFVTCKSFSQIYLNEGFAAFVENLGADAIYPEFQVWSQFPSDVLQKAFIVDQTIESSHPLVNDTFVNTGQFDSITYKKGASIIRMMQDFIGKNTFQIGLQTYLKKFAFGNTHQNDLFDTLNQVSTDLANQANNHEEFSLFKKSGQNLHEIMNSWTLQNGYPLVRVTIANQNNLQFTQEPFVFNETVRGNEEHRNSSKGWWIPIKILQGSHHDQPADGVEAGLVVPGHSFWMPNDRQVVLYPKVDTTRAEDLLVVNPDAIGYYRVLYDDELSRRILNQFKQNHSRISSSTRSQIIDDYFTFGFSKYIEIEQALDFTLHLDKETEYNVWTAAFGNLRKVLRLFKKTEAYEKLRSYLKVRINSALNLIGYDQKPDEKGISVITRSRLLEFAVLLDDEESLQRLRHIYELWKEDPEANPIPTDLEESVYGAVVKSKLKGAWHFLFIKLMDGQDNDFTKRRLQNAIMGYTRRDDDLSKVLKNARLFSTAKNTKQEISQNYDRLANNPEAHNVLLDFLQEKLLLQNSTKSQINSSSMHNDIPIERIISLMTIYFHSDEDLAKMTNLVNLYKEAKSSPNSTVLNSSLKRIHENRRWMNEFYKPITDWLVKHTTIRHRHVNP